MKIGWKMSHEILKFRKFSRNSSWPVAMNMQMSELMSLSSPCNFPFTLYTEMTYMFIFQLSELGSCPQFLLNNWLTPFISILHVQNIHWMCIVYLFKKCFVKICTSKCYTCRFSLFCSENFTLSSVKPVPEFPFKWFNWPLSILHTHWSALYICSSTVHLVQLTSSTLKIITPVKTLW